jgi:hypothetical protein
MKKVISLILIPAIILTGCSGLNTKDDYNKSTSHLASDDITTALKSLPRGEGKTFITIMESTYLNLLAGKPEINTLAAYSRTIENQVRYKISRGVKSFFFIETPDGYYASEHEIIWMHFLLCWGYSLKGDIESARVEVNRAAVLLSNEFSSEGRFDDPFMRIICGLMWNICGEWDDARADFRRALQLDPKIKWLKPLVNMEEAPANMVLLLGGTGYEPYWDPDAKGLVRGLRGVSFKSKGSRIGISLSGGEYESLNLFITPDSSYWYKRHEVRNSELSDVIDDFKYTQKFGVSSGKLVSHIALAVGGGLLIFTLIGGAGLGLVALGAYANSGEVMGAGAAVFVYGGYKGYDFASEQCSDAKTNYRKEMNPADKYRFVRFLPEYGWLGWSSKKITPPVSIKSGTKKILLKNSYVIKGKGRTMTFGYYPDTNQ